MKKNNSGDFALFTVEQLRLEKMEKMRSFGKQSDEIFVLFPLR